MKDATGELSMTAVAVVAIAAVALIFQQFVWPGIKANLKRNTMCTSAYNCKYVSGSSGTMECDYIDESGKTTRISCADQR